MFAVATPGGWRVMPGGLTRVAAEEDSRVIAMQRGGRSKDTWVLSDAPVNASFSLLSQTVAAENLVDANATLASRAAENLFWFGRYGERCDGSVRLLRVALGHVLDDSGGRSGRIPPAWELARQVGLIDSTAKHAPRQLRRAATSPEAALHQRLRQLSRVAFNLRDRMSADNWRTLNRVIADPVFSREPSLPHTLVWLDRAVTAHDDPLGLRARRHDARHRLALPLDRPPHRAAVDPVQRAAGRARATAAATASTGCSTSPTRPSPTARATWRRPSGCRCSTCWCATTPIRARSRSRPRAWPNTSPSSSPATAPSRATALAPAHAALLALRPEDLDPESELLSRTLEQLQRAAFAVSDELSLKFFSHAVPRSVLSLVA